ncbi:MAG: hypothetical protein NVSMB62_03400 [Acidobacteriaceae bacterium]
MQMECNKRVRLPKGTKDRWERNEHSRTDKPDVERSHLPAANAAGLLNVTSHIV